MPTEIWCPFAEKIPVPLRDSQQVWIESVGTVDHTSVTDSWMLKPTGTVRWTWYVNFAGRIGQFFPMNRPAACQRDGNLWRSSSSPTGYRGFNSIETQDGAGRLWDGRDVRDCPPLSDDQIHSIAKLHAWQHNEFGIPIRLPKHCRETGFGYHSLFTASSGLRWNTTHACMTKTRNDQHPLILAEARRLASVPTPPPEEDDMPTAQEIVKALLEARIGPQNRPVEEYLVGTRNAISEAERDRIAEDQADDAIALATRADVRALTSRLDALEGKLDAALTREDPS